MSSKGFLSGHGRQSREEKEFYELKIKAAEYFGANAISQKLEAALNEAFFEQPNDIHGYLANYFSKLSSSPVISRIWGKEIYNGRGQLTVQAEVYCIIKNEEKSICSAVIPSDCRALKDSSQESGEGIPNGAKQNQSVSTALHWINQPLCKMLKGLDPTDQTAVDKLLSDFFMERYLENLDVSNKEEEEEKELREPEPEPSPPPAPSKDKKHKDKGKKRNSKEKPEPSLTPPDPPVSVVPGCMAVGAVSLAVAKTAALLMDTPLYKHISSLRGLQALSPLHMPIPMITLLSCGKASPGKLNLMDEVILVPGAGQRAKQVIAMCLELQEEVRRILSISSEKGPVLVGLSESGSIQGGYDHPEQPLDLITEASNNLGLALGEELCLAVNCAAHELMDYPRGKYEVMNGTPKSPDELVDMYISLKSKYPGLMALIDPFRKEDVEQWEKLSAAIGTSCCILADKAAEQPTCSSTEARPNLPGVKGVILKHSDETTVTDLLNLIKEHTGGLSILSVSYGEACDDSLSDMAVGLGVTYLKLGGLSGGERATKYNRLICIEEELAQQGILGTVI
ncbi:enolase 4 [Chanos chanos]|uniref:Enolase 4 n=1 Tax=Chanos chanos TaxID=29144 RepID=A0A6J2WGB3_CHACN|nr:enolase 4 [Chanos chanos]